MKETLTIASNLRERIAKSTSALTLVVIAIFSAVVFFPDDISASAYQYKHLILAGTLVIYFSAQLLYQHRDYIFTAIDVWWGALLTYTALSMFWGASSSTSIEHAFHFLILYLVFKAFENISWEEVSTRKIFFIVAIIAYSLLILFQVSYIFHNGLLGDQPVYNNGNYHFVPCLLSVIILPYVVFTKEDISNYLVAFLFGVNIWTAMVLEMPQAVIVLMLLIVSYTLFKLTYIQRIKYFVLFGFIAVLGISLFYTVNNNYNLKLSPQLNPVEFKSAAYISDFQNTIKKIGEAPLIGHGSGSLSSLSTHKQTTQNAFHYPNNALLAILAELGLVGLIMICYIGLFPILRLFNERNILSTLELAAVVSVALFFFLSLFYGEMYSQSNYLATAPIVAIIGLAQISKKANANTLISQTSNKGISIVLLCMVIGCLVFYLG